ncbi:hypothetical protein [Stackebrandtia nassauensis]|uniref:Extracellular repeat protein, HAF family n=1 Tax=Stackebrandtia nassauensis (strain DSM 44728 / CIP 108903 / NRRL B-16338 / NBRC 102104 / LLR-40K-21) TaxID=446470 RepID=D3QBM8_STANL|nr:hypothetical protein [Stackebrandtia nassauensis]ADD42910.1 hypothetical protein Snas_3240 [Stackebrandtia nassauensis DSM 44728]
MNARPKLLLALAGGVAAAAIAVPVVSAVADGSPPAGNSASNSTADCELTELAFPDGYDKDVKARSVSASGEYAAGGALGEDGDNPVLWHDGKAIVPEELKSDTTGASAVNDSGQMVGSRGAGEATVPWLYQDGKVTNLKVPKGQSGNSRDINNAGQVVGYTQDDEGRTFPALWPSPDAEPVLLDNPFEDGGGRAYSINEEGTISGKLIDPQDMTVHLWKWTADGKGEELKRPDPGDMVDQDVKTSISGDHVVSVNIAPIGAFPAYAWNLSEGTDGTEIGLPVVEAVSADGTIVGLSKDDKPAMLIDGAVTELPGVQGPASNTDVAHDINQKGDVIVGGVVDENDKQHPAMWNCG